MNDTAVPIYRIISATGWGLSAILLTAAWIVTLVANHGVGDMLGMTAVIAAGIGGIAQVRIYTVHVCAILRAIRAERELGTEMHSLHSLH